jgi:hypothetical protein
VGVNDLARGGNVVPADELDPLDMSDGCYPHRPEFLRLGWTQRGRSDPTASLNSSMRNGFGSCASAPTCEAQSTSRSTEPLLYVGPVDLPSQPPFGPREKRIAYNEARSRDINEHKAEWLDRGHESVGFLCECWQADCREHIRLSVNEWNEARGRPNRFAVAPGHVEGEIERVVEEHPHFWLIEKQGEAGEMARKMA